jgi:hypothetical protein
VGREGRPLTPGQRKTTVRLACLFVAGLGLGVLLLAVELQGAAAHDHATISELVWLLWATHPWVIFLVSHLVAGPVWFLSGHFVAQRREVYDDIRGARW